LYSMQLCAEHDKDLSVCVVEKGAEVGAHILSGNVFQPTALDELIPDWKEDESCPVGACPVISDRFYFLTRKRTIRLPTPPQMHNRGNYVISLSEMVRWLGSRAESLGVEIFPGFAAAKPLYAPNGSVAGVITNDVGIAKNGTRK
ncbi:NAD(P)/FAD-dependent oxidoreductase, partial [Salmonella enterica]|uniref:NAD(P)/FAD-dependent oxidoreductase n=1 Tax=Salmonella enterica TaxID=28901 RepID=UPI003523D6F9